LLVNASAQDSEEAPEARPRKVKAKARKAAAQPPSLELYNLATDVGEKTNLASQEPERVAALRAKLEELLKNAAPPGQLGLLDQGLLDGVPPLAEFHQPAQTQRKGS
jgi:hypothetical protein